MIALIALFRLAVEQPSLARGGNSEIAEDSNFERILTETSATVRPLTGFY